jgi:hypothetical protein
MEEILGIVLFLLLIGGASALRWWIEKQQREKEAEEQDRRTTPAAPPAPTPGRRPIFYVRPVEKTRFAAPESEPIDLETLVLTPTDRQILQPAALQQADRPAPPRRQPAARRRGARRPARREAEPQPSPAPQAEPLKPPGTIKAAAPVAGPQDTPFLGSLLGGRNVAKAIVLSEILGPPKAFRDF